MEEPLRRNCPSDLKVIETFRVEDGRIIRMELHLGRLLRTCLSLGIPLAQDMVRHHILQIPQQGAYRVRLTVDLQGVVEVQAVLLGAISPKWVVAVAPERLSSKDPWLRIKTTQRAFYDDMRRSLPQGVDEWVFLNERDELCEGTITNIFVKTDDALATPAVAAGLLPGILRESLLASGHAYESPLHVDDLQKAFWVGNSLRGLIPAELITLR